jgi:para-nitrobenzyl esterase
MNCVRKNKNVSCRFLSMSMALLLLFIFPNVSKAQCHGRYLTSIFNEVEVTSVKYGENINSDGQLEELYLDVYEPTGDIETNRPLIILAHGGAFIKGELFDLNGLTYKSGTVVKLCKTFASMGYVCASIEYRRESNPLALLFEERMIKAIFRSVHDGKAAIRYFKKNAAEGNQFAIDPNQIIIGGESSGAILALHLPYITDLDMLPGLWYSWAQQLGGDLEGNSGNPGYNTDVRGIINVSGAFGKPEFIKGNNIPLLHIHGTADPIVPYGVDNPFGIPWLPNMYGSMIIHEKALEEGIKSTLITYPGRGHVPYIRNFPIDNSLNPEIWDSTISQISNFAYSLLDCNPDNQVVTGLQDKLNSTIQLFPNPTSGHINLTVTNELANSKVSIFSVDGSEVVNLTMNGINLQNQLSLPPGIYFIRITSPGKTAKEYYRRFIVSY